MYCPNCGTYNKDTANFCYSCGEALEIPHAHEQSRPAPPKRQPRPATAPAKTAPPPAEIESLPFRIVTFGVGAIGMIVAGMFQVFGELVFEDILRGNIALDDQSLVPVLGSAFLLFILGSLDWFKIIMRLWVIVMIVGTVAIIIFAISNGEIQLPPEIQQLFDSL